MIAVGGARVVLGAHGLDRVEVDLPILHDVAEHVLEEAQSEL